VAVVVALELLVILVVPAVLMMEMVVPDFKFKSHQMDPTSTMLVEAVVEPGHQAHLLMLVMVD
tara:strand:- start:8 stop:196 length:189 start_codon:yes stop_codon:yes gene_type:complete